MCSLEFFRMALLFFWGGLLYFQSQIPLYNLLYGWSP